MPSHFQQRYKKIEETLHACYLNMLNMLFAVIHLTCNSMKVATVK